MKDVGVPPQPSTRPLNATGPRPIWNCENTWALPDIKENDATLIGPAQDALRDNTDSGPLASVIDAVVSGSTIDHFMEGNGQFKQNVAARHLQKESSDNSQLSVVKEERPEIPQLL